MNTLMTINQSRESEFDRLFDKMQADLDAGVYDDMFAKMESDHDIYEEMHAEMQADENGTFARLREELQAEIEGGIVFDGEFTKL